MLHCLLRIIEGADRQQLEQGLHWLYAFVRPQRRAIGGLLLLALLGSGIVLLQPWLTKLLIDDGLLAGDYPMLLQIALAMVGVGIGGTLLSGLNRWLHTRLSGRILFALRSDLYQHLLRQSPSFFAGRRIGDLLARMDGDIAEIQRFAVDSLFAAVSSVVGLIGALALLLLLNWQLALLVAVLVPLEFLWLRWMRGKVEAETRLTRERATDLSSFLIETLPATRFIQGSGREAHEQARLGQFSERYLDQLLARQLTEFATQAVPSTLTSLTRACAFLIGGWWVIEGQWQLGALIAFSTYLGMATGPVNSLLGLYVAIQRMSVSLVRVAELRQVEPAVQQPASPQRWAQPPRGVIELQGLHFAHAGRPPVLQGASARIEAGEKVALCGASGAGKSTLIDLLQRFADPQQGSIHLDGIDLRQLDLAELRGQIAVVSQDITLFRASLLDNLRYCAPHAELAAVEQALRDARLDELVAQLPDGLHSLIGERGQMLSGGQRQRIAIARALLQQPAVLVLDEATSQVDEATEQQVIAAIDRLFPTTTRILISHRPSTLQGCQRRLRLEGGVLHHEEPSHV